MRRIAEFFHQGVSTMPHIHSPRDPSCGTSKGDLSPMCSQNDDPSQHERTPGERLGALYQESLAQQEDERLIAADAFNRAEDARIEALIADKYPGIAALSPATQTNIRRAAALDPSVLDAYAGLIDSTKTDEEPWPEDDPDWNPYTHSNLTFNHGDLLMIRDGVALLTPEDPAEIERQSNMLELLRLEIGAIAPLTEPAEQTDEEAEMLEVAGFDPICGYAWSVHDTTVLAARDAASDLRACPNYGRHDG